MPFVGAKYVINLARTFRFTGSSSLLRAQERMGKGASGGAVGQVLSVASTKL